MQFSTISGQTECAAASTLGIEADTRAGHVGIPSICNAVKLVDVPELEYYAKDMACFLIYSLFSTEFIFWLN